MILGWKAATCGYTNCSNMPKYTGPVTVGSQIKNGPMILSFIKPHQTFSFDCRRKQLIESDPTVSLLYDLAGGSACRRGPCDLHCISPLISLWRPHLSSLMRQSDLCSRTVHTWINKEVFSIACSVFKMPTYTLQQRIFMYDLYVITSSCTEVVRRFQVNYSSVRVPSREAVRLLVNRFREMGSILDKKRNVKRRVLTEQKLEEMWYGTFVFYYKKLLMWF